MFRGLVNSGMASLTNSVGLAGKGIQQIRFFLLQKMVRDAIPWLGYFQYPLPSALADGSKVSDYHFGL